MRWCRAMILFCILFMGYAHSGDVEAREAYAKPPETYQPIPKGHYSIPGGPYEIVAYENRMKSSYGFYPASIRYEKKVGMKLAIRFDEYNVKPYYSKILWLTVPDGAKPITASLVIISYDFGNTWQAIEETPENLRRDARKNAIFSAARKAYDHIMIYGWHK